MHTVLLIEDSRVLRIANQRLLIKEGYDVVCGADGHEALTLAIQCHPDVILLDLMLPKVSGLDVLRMLKKDPATTRIPVIIVTGLSQKNEASLLRDGAHSFVEKDAVLRDPKSLMQAIEAALAKKATAEARNGMLAEAHSRL